MNKLGFVNMLNDGFRCGRTSPKINAILTDKPYRHYSYIHILKHVVVGDIMAPLLHMVDMKSKQSHGKMHETPDSLLYVPLQKKHFATIEINIMTDTGEPVHFVDGKRLPFWSLRDSDCSTKSYKNSLHYVVALQSLS